MQRLAAVIITVALATPSAALAHLSQGDFELTLSAVGVSPGSTNGLQTAFATGVGYFLTDNLELALRQQIVYDDFNVAAAFSGATIFAVDWNLTTDSRWQPFIGAQIGYRYGDLVSDSLQAGPEAGIRYFVARGAFLFFVADYQFMINSSGNDDDQFNFSIGIGITF